MVSKIKDNSKSSNKSIENSMNYVSLIAPIFSISIMVLGMGALTTYTTLRLHDFNTEEWLIGIVSAAYFIGMTVGGYKIQHLILRVGHIRTFAACSAVFGASSLMQGLFEYPWSWIFFRFTAGFVLSGCFLVIESWLLGGSIRKNRGVILAIYMISYYCGQACGQFIIKIPNIQPIEIYLTCSVFFILSLLPVTLTRFHAPYAEEPHILSFRTIIAKAPVAFYGALCAGFILSVIYSLYPLYLSYNNWSNSDVATFMFALLIGATLGQYPIGWLSDKLDRRIVLSGILILAAIIFTIISQQYSNYYYLLLCSTFLGIFTFTIYPLSINHGLDYFNSKELISATAGIMLAYGIGSIMGPSMVSISMKYLGNNGFIIIPIIAICILLCSISYLLMRRAAIPHEDKGHYTPVTDTTIEIVQMDPEIKERDIKSRHVEQLENP